jgi:hypothetical protein
VSDALLLVVLTLAAYRVWRLLFVDDFPPVMALRERMVRATFDRHGSEWSDGFGCPWCSGFWVSCAVVGITWTFVSLPLPGLWFLAVPALVGLIGTTLDDD